MPEPANFFTVFSLLSTPEAGGVVLPLTLSALDTEIFCVQRLDREVCVEDDHHMNLRIFTQKAENSVRITGKLGLKLYLSQCSFQIKS